MEIKPIRNEEDYQATLTEIDQIFDAAPGSPEADKLDVLTTLVEAFEEENYPIGAPHPIEAILHSLEALDLTRRDLEPLLGSRSRVSEILNRKRSLSLGMIRRLEEALQIPAEILIQPYELVDETSPIEVMTALETSMRDRPVSKRHFSAMAFSSTTAEPQTDHSASALTDCYLNADQDSIEAITIDDMVGSQIAFDTTSESRSGYHACITLTPPSLRNRCQGIFPSFAWYEATSPTEAAI